MTERTTMINEETGEIVGLEDNPEIKYTRPHVRTPYNYNRDMVSLATGLDTPEATLTQQQFADDADINVILERFGVTGQLPQNISIPNQGDFTNVLDYQSALNAVIEAQRAFGEMPATVRDRFGNDPAKFLQFAYDPSNAEEARKMGLLVPSKTPPEPLAVRVVDGGAPAPTSTSAGPGK